MNNMNSFFQQCPPVGQQPQVTFVGGDNEDNTAQQASWQCCRFCQQKFFATPNKLLEHEVSCPMHMQVQQFLQQQNQQQRNQLQAQLQMQQDQMQAQFIKHQLQGAGVMTPNAAFGMGGGNAFFGNADATSIQQPSSIICKPVTSAIDLSDVDPFESAVSGLPAFEPMDDKLSYPSSCAIASPDGTKYLPLAMPDDEEWLTPLHCFVRRYCVEIFVATPEDVAAPCMGKRNPVHVNQVGIRCPYCSPERLRDRRHYPVDIARARENGVVYPSLIARIYNSSINLLQRHLKSCSFVPPEIVAKYDELKSSNARSGASKKYWADSAVRLGLMDTPGGIRLDVEAHKKHLDSVEAESSVKSTNSNAISANVSCSNVSNENAPPLVLPSDKRNTTAFTFHLMSQMQPCVFTEADRLGRRRDLRVGFAGLACRHCFGVYGSGRFFPSSVKTMADASKTLDVIYRHINKCKKCPNDIKGGLSNLRDFHELERSKMPFGNQRAFFVKVWGRLHEGDDMMAAPAAKQEVPRPVPSPPSSMASALDTPPKAAPENLQGLYALVKNCNGNGEQNKLANEAA